MSEMTLANLLSFDVGVWHASADRWWLLARGIDDATDQLIRGTRDLPHAWPSGAGSAAAAGEATAVRGMVGNTYNPARRIHEAMVAHAYAMSSLRQQARDIVAAAEQAGYTVDTATVSITAPASAYMGGNLDRTGRETGALLNDLRTVVEYARAQDDATAGALNENVPKGPGGFGATPAGAITRAEELARKLKDPMYEPTAAELDELRDLVQLYGKDKAFAHALLTSLGPKGLLELNGTLATYQLDQPGKETDDALFDRDRAAMVRDLQNGLGVMLSTATAQTGTMTGYRGETYVPGENELSSKWVAELMEAGRSKMDIGDPNSHLRYVEDIYGYQLLGPLLRGGGFDAGFLSTVGGDIVDFEMEQGKEGALWNEARGENLRLDWTRGHDDNTVPAGLDPMNGLMEALSHNGEATREMLTEVSVHTADGPPGGRLPRLDYLLTDRNWEATGDMPGGSTWTTEEMANKDKYRNEAIDRFGVALERATTETPGPEARRLFESIVYEINADEQAKGYKDGERIPADNEKGADTKAFRDNNLIDPQIRDSMGNIVAAHIVDVNLNMNAGDIVVEGESVEVDKGHLTRFLADIGKDEGAHATIALAEAVYAASAYEEIVSGRQNPDDDINGRVRAMENVSHRYGGVMGALDFGAAEGAHANREAVDAQHNKNAENLFKVIGPLTEGVVGAAATPVPGAGDLANGFVEQVMDDLEESMKVDNQGKTTFEVGAALNAGEHTASALAEMAFYQAGDLKELPERLIVEGRLKPSAEWNNEDHKAWERYKSGDGQSTVNSAATNAAESYQGGYTWAEKIINGSATAPADPPK